MSLTFNEMHQYAKQIKLEQIGIAGQLKLKNSRVLCIGAGGLGTSLLLYLTTAGIGKLGIADDDEIELSNLHRQPLYQHSHLGYKKAIIAKQQLSALNPQIEIVAHTERVTLENAHALIHQYDIVADCSDNFSTRYLINDVCYHQNKPYVFASINQYEGQCALFLAGKNPCFRCLFPFATEITAVPDCNTAGVLGVLPGLFGIIQATEIIKWILKFTDNLSGTLLVGNLLPMQFLKFHLTRNPDCPLCVFKQSAEQLAQAETPMTLASISIVQLQEKLKRKEDLTLLDVRSTMEHAAHNLGGILIPLAELSQRLNELNPQQPIIVYCQSGKRSIEAVKLLTAANFPTVMYLQGGLAASAARVMPACF